MWDRGTSSRGAGPYTAPLAEGAAMAALALAWPPRRLVADGCRTRTVPRLWTSPSYAPTRTERHVGPPETRLRHLDEPAGGSCTTERGGGNDDRPPVASTDGPSDRFGDQDHRARHDPAESSTVI